ncbi:MAG: L-2-amino-thiazoline-4-carboxylic acid hydrolase [Deltaproteobacteria bacterium]|nr:L-2-amino-thiazoline-4-carboxylic acid hydrolase [Deltaproteobacteria bacterium]MBW2369605.1 L-2-amino-thiazoline-4-carboxylic acid hydrolase [Deltaproteobacteria bacterium]
MGQTEHDKLPQNPTEAQGLLIKAVYSKFGREALPLIRDVCGKQGTLLGSKIKKKLLDNSLSTVAAAFAKSFDPSETKVVAVSNEQFRIQGTRCPFGLENTSRELCEAVMAIDLEYFKEAVNDRIKLEITRTVAAGDECCDTIYSLNE